MTSKNMGSKINVTEIRDKVFSEIIDYAHNVKKGETIYHPGFSPNNIKRLVICPDRVVAYYYVVRKNDKQIPLDRNSAASLFPASKLMKAVMYPDYKPLISVLSDPLVCASIQEVLFVTEACNEPIELTPREYDLQCLIKSYNNKQADIFESVKKRYKRLAYISVFKGNYNDLKASMGEQKTNFFCEKEGIKARLIKQIPLNVDTWYDNWGQNAADSRGLNGYQLDNNGSALNTYFKQVQAKNKAKHEKEEDGYEKYKAEKEKIDVVLSTAFEVNLKSYKAYVKCIVLLQKTLAENGNYLYSNTLFQPYAQQIHLWETAIYKENEKDSKYGIHTMKGSSTNMEIASMSGEDKVRMSISRLQQQTQMVYQAVITALADEIRLTSIAYGSELVRVLFHDFDNVLKPLPELDSEIASIKDICQKDVFKGERMKDAMASACYLMCLLYLSERTDSDIAVCFNRAYWYKILDV